MSAVVHFAFECFDNSQFDRRNPSFRTFAIIKQFIHNEFMIRRNNPAAINDQGNGLTTVVVSGPFINAKKISCNHSGHLSDRRCCDCWLR